MSLKMKKNFPPSLQELESRRRGRGVLASSSSSADQRQVPRAAGRQSLKRAPTDSACQNPRRPGGRMGASVMRHNRRNSRATIGSP